MVNETAQGTPTAYAPMDAQELQLSIQRHNPHSTSAKTKARRRKRLLYPMNKLARQRSVEFNLNLDINNLRQEMQSLLQLRDILATKALMTRISPSGSLMQMVHELYARIGPGGAESLATFLPTMMHDDVDCYDGCIGYKAILLQNQKFTELMGYLGMFLKHHEFVESPGDEAHVKIRTSGILRTRLTHESLRAVFPHVLAHEKLCLYLIGQIVDFTCDFQFIFDNDSKVRVFGVEIDFVAGLSTILGPADIALVLGSARIAHSMICVDDEQPALADDGVFEVTDGEFTGEEEQTDDGSEELSVFSGEPIGELPSLFALDDQCDGEEMLVCENRGIAPIDLSELFHF